MSTVVLVLLVAGFICLALATFGVAPPRINLLAAGLALWLLAELIPALAAA
jgi:hypothetical protein